MTILIHSLRFSLGVLAVLALGVSPRAAASDPPWSSGEYAYDGSGSIKAVGAERYTYDTVGRLTSGSVGRGRLDGRTQRYEYDGFGNLRAIAVDGGARRELAIDPLTNRLPAVYDAAGNQLGENGSPARTYDAFSSMTVAANGAQYVYDASDERVAITNGTRTDWRWTIRDLGARAVREFRETGPAGGAMTWSWSKDYVYRGSSLLGAYVHENGATKRLHYHLDHLGTPRLTTEARDNAAPVGRLEVSDYPFGEEVTFTANNTETRRFTGHERDYDSGTAAPNPNYVDYMHARFYSPLHGRFLSVDPGRDWNMRQPQSWNLYSYVRNDPLNKVDPNGREGIGALVGAVVGYVGGAIVEVHSQGWGYRAPVDYSKVGKAALGGAAAGLITGACTCPAAIGGAAGSVIGGTLTRTLNGESLSSTKLSTVVVDAAGGAVGAVAGKALGAPIARANSEGVRMTAAAVRTESLANNQGLGADRIVQPKITALTVAGQQAGDAVAGTLVGMMQDSANQKIEELNKPQR